MIRAPFKKTERGECFMCWEKRQCMKVGPAETVYVCGICYTHPCCESLIEDMFESWANETEQRIDAAYTLPKKTRAKK